MVERDITAAEVEVRHLAEVRQSVHWLYVLVVLGGGTVAMLALIALLGATATP
jgi:hypothetical protein